MKDPVAASRIAETLRGWRDEFSRTGNAGDAFSQAEDARSSGDAQDDLGGEDRRRVIFRFFLHRAFWRMAKAHDAVAHQSMLFLQRTPYWFFSRSRVNALCRICGLTIGFDLTTLWS